MAPSLEPDIAGFIAEYHAFYPQRAIWDGRHEYDGQVPDFSRTAIRRRIAALQRWTGRLSAPVTPVASGGAVGPCEDRLERERALAQYVCAEELFRWREWRPHERNPGFYHGALDVSIYLKRPYAPGVERLSALTRHLRGVADILAAARENLRLPLSTPAVEQAIHAYKGLRHYYDQHLRPAGLDLAPSLTLAMAFEEALGGAIRAMDGFIAFLREQTGGPSGDFRLGGETLAAMIWWGEQVDVPLSHLRAIGVADLERHRARAQELAGRMRMSVVEAFEALGQAHSLEHEVLAETAVAVEEVRDYLERAGVISSIGDAPYRVAATPSYMRAGAAFMDAPGPFERTGQPAYLYVTLPDPEWPATLREDWLAKLNPWGLRNTAAHEAYPGHLLQFRWLARNASFAARAFTSYACIEGWAHYAEHLTVEAGFGEDDPRIELAQLSMAMLRDCRYLVAIDLHSGQTTIPEAIDFLASQTHLAPIRCRQEVLRGAQDPGYLYYTLGKLMLLRLREDYERQEGQRYSLRGFHEAFLACGAPPVPLARRMLLAEPGTQVL